MVTNTLDTIEYGRAASASARQTGRSCRHPQAARAAAPTTTPRPASAPGSPRPVASSTCRDGGGVLLGEYAGGQRERRAPEPDASSPNVPPGAQHEPPGPEPAERRQLLRPADDAGHRLGVHGMRGEEERGRPCEPRPVRDL